MSGGNTAAGRAQKSIQQSLGSGVIVTADSGYILTNNHVVEGADDVKIKYGAAQKEYKAKIVIGPTTPRPTWPCSRSTPAPTCRPRPWATATNCKWATPCSPSGDPFGVGLSRDPLASSAPWAGTISASRTYEDFIQTDAPINPGNSGGGPDRCRTAGWSASTPRF